MAKKNDDKKFIVFMLVLIFLMVGILLAAGQARAQDEYGLADFSRRDCFTRDKLVGCWSPTSAKPKGDSFQGQGDFESWDGAKGDCTNCPAGWDCSCASDSDFDREQSYVYKNSSSIKFSVDASTSGLNLTRTFTFEANKSYQLSFWTKGTDGTEDFGVQIYSGGVYYHEETDSWTGVAGYYSATNIATTWTRHVIYIKGDATERTNFTVLFKRLNASQVFYIDDVQIRELETQGVTSDTEILFEPITDGDPFFYDSGMTTNDGVLECDDSDDYFEPANQSGHFSTCIRAVPTVIDDYSYIFGHSASAGNIQWDLSVSNDDYRFFISEDGSTVSDVFQYNIAIAGNKIIECGTYEMKGSGSSVLRLYSNNEDVSEDTAANGPVYDTSNTITIGGLHAGGGAIADFDGDILEVCYWDKPLSAIEANKFINPYFPGNNHGDGFWVDTCTHTAPHAVCSWGGCRDGTPNLCEAEGTGSMAFFGATTELVVDNSFETNNGTDQVADFSDWVESRINGDGTATIEVYHADSFHGDQSVLLTLANGATRARLNQCFNVSPSTTYYGELYRRLISSDGTVDLDMFAYQYTGADCTTDSSYYGSFVNGDVPNKDWKVAGAAFETAADTASIRVYVDLDFEGVATAQNAKVLVDAVSVKAARYHTPFVENPSGSVTTSTTTKSYRLHNVLGDYIQEQKSEAYVNGFCASAWIYTDWDDTEDQYHYIAIIDGTGGGSENGMLWLYHSNGSFYIYVNDSTGDYIRLNFSSPTWSSGWHYFEFCTSNTGTLVGHYYNVATSSWNSTTSISGTGSGIQTDQRDYINLYNGNYPLDGFIQHFTISPYSATYPNKNFNNGVPPTDPY